MKHTLSLTILTLLLSMIISSCYSPNPLYGKWADNQGSTITFNSDMTYSAKITNAGTSTDYSGKFTVIENVLIFSKDTGGSINTEWDIRGSILYCYWLDNNGIKQDLTLYHIGK